MSNNNNDLDTHNCPECGHANESESADLWTLCESCDAHLVSDSDVLAVDEAEAKVA